MTVNPYRRTNQIRTRPMTAETMPTIRRILSGVASALFIARRIQAGLAANIRPSSTQRMPTPTRKSVNAMDLIGWQPPAIQASFAFMPANRARFAVTRVFPAERLRLRRRGRRRMARRIGEEAEELGIRPQQETGVGGAEPGLVGRHRTIEGEEIRIPAIGLGEQAVALGVAHAAGLLGGRIGLRDDDGGLAVGLGADLLRLLAALGAELRRFALPFGLHALIDRLAVGLRQIGATDAHVDQLNAVLIGLPVELVADARHEALAFVAHDRDEGDLAQHPAQRRVQQRGELDVGGLDRADALIEAQRVLDPVAGEGVDDEPLLVGSDDFL